MKYNCLIILLLFPAISFCQDTLRGKVISEKGMPMQGASVFISNTSIGMQTNANGGFALTKLPAGNIKIVISYVGYEPVAVAIAATARSKQYVIQLQPKNNELAAITIANYNKNGWKKWGDAFLAAFIGTSVYAEKCIIKNTDVINFIYTPATKLLHAYADEPLIIENRALGYQITVTLVDFIYDFTTRNVDYRVYSLFRQMEGTDDEMAQWNRNRAKVYSLSLMHFMRALYVHNLKNEGFEMRLLEKKKNAEKERIQELYKQQYSIIKYASDSSELKGNITNRMIEKSFSKDSLKYYRKILAQDDRIVKLHTELLNSNNIAKQTDSNTLVLHFTDYIQVTYKKAKEPEEYVAYLNENNQASTLIDAVNSKVNVPRNYPVTEFNLEQGIPIEIAENGYYNNVDLFMNGFWGWWERIATTLPYEYEP